MKIWIPIDETPPMHTVLLFKGPSGMIPPKDIAIRSGHYDPDYRPDSPYLNEQNYRLSDEGIVPTHWMPLARLDDLELMIVEATRGDEATLTEMQTVVNCIRSAETANDCFRAIAEYRRSVRLGMCSVPE